MQKLIFHTHLTPFLLQQNPNKIPNFHFSIPIKPLHSIIFSPLFASNESSISPILPVGHPNSYDDNIQSDQFSEKIQSSTKPSFDDSDATLSGEMAMYKAILFMRNNQFAEAEQILRKCIHDWPEHLMAYVELGKLLEKQSRVDEARAVYENGCKATNVKNAYILQLWALLERKKGNLRRARELFNAATVADEKCISAWHCWAILELKERNTKKAKKLLTKALKFCGGNEYIDQSLGMIEAIAKRFAQARYFYRQATNYNPDSSASWVVWARMEAQEGNHRVARRLFEEAVRARPKNVVAWHAWGFFEANLGNVDQARRLLNICYALNPEDQVVVRTLKLLECKHSSPIDGQNLFKKASDVYPQYQAVWTCTEAVYDDAFSCVNGHLDITESGTDSIRDQNLYGVGSSSESALDSNIGTSPTKVQQSSEETENKLNNQNVIPSLANIKEDLNSNSDTDIYELIQTVVDITPQREWKRVYLRRVQQQQSSGGTESPIAKVVRDMNAITLMDESNSSEFDQD